jgi:hypothetical protein
MLNETTSAKRALFYAVVVAELANPTPSDKEIMGCFDLASLRMLTKNRSRNPRASNAAVCFLCLGTATIKNLAV